MVCYWWCFFCTVPLTFYSKKKNREHRRIVSMWVCMLSGHIVKHVISSHAHPSGKKRSFISSKKKILNPNNVNLACVLSFCGSVARWTQWTQFYVYNCTLSDRSTKIVNQTQLKTLHSPSYPLFQLECVISVLIVHSSIRLVNIVFEDMVLFHIISITVHHHG